MATKVIQPKSLSDSRPRYVHGILAGGGKLLFMAGQLASDKDGNVVGKGDIEAQTHQVFKNMNVILKKAGGSLDNLVMTTTYITDRKYREGHNRVRIPLLKKNPPTNTLVIVKGFSNKDFMIEITGIAVL